MKRRRALLFTLTAVLALCATGGWWLHKLWQQYVLNRQLIAALEHGDTKQALALVNDGADPNTLCSAPSPSWEELLQQRLHSARLFVNNSPMAFMVACGDDWERNDSPLIVHPSLLDDPQQMQLIQAMLVHGAKIDFQNAEGNTALALAVNWKHPNTVALLLKHHANPNLKDREGHTPLSNALAMRPHFTSGSKHFPLKQIIHLLKQAGAK